MASGYEGLSESQRQAVRAHAPLMILSTAGSGKSTVLTHRIAHTLRNNPEATVCGVSFTAESARHLRDKAVSLAPECADRMVFGTFHSLALRMLQAAGRKPAIADEGRQAALLGAAFADVAGRHPGMKFDAFLAYIEQIKRCLDPLLEPDHINPNVAGYLRYQELLSRNGLMDFSDLLLEAVRGMRDGTVDAIRCSEMLIDEAQDTDALQLEFIMGHRRAGAEITLVGDDDQAIYAWRGALAVDLFTHFKETTGAGQINLTTTFRCPREIFVPAARLIMRNSLRLPKDLNSSVREQGSVKALRMASEAEEADAVIAAVRRSGDPNKWAVLARKNESLDAIEVRLKLHKIPYTRKSSQSYWAHPPTALVLGICTDLATGSVAGFEQLMRRCGVAQSRIDSLHQQADARRPGALKRMADLAGKKDDTDVCNTILRRARDWSEMIEAGNAAGVLDAMDTFLLSQLEKAEGKKRSKAMADYETKMIQSAINVMICAGRVASNAPKAGGAASGAPSGAGKGKAKADLTDSGRSMQERVMSATRSERATGNEKETGVHLMSLHASKGLEFPYTWIIGVDKDTLPFKGSPVEEERRLMFVGMTRASRQLFISYNIEGERAASPFLEEAGVLP